MAVAKRSEIAPEHTWNAPSLFESDEAWEQAYEKMAARLPEIERFQGHLADNADRLTECLQTVESIMLGLGKVAVYAGMSASVDANNQDAARMMGRARSLIGQLRAATGFLEPEILAIGQDTLQDWMQNVPTLQQYEHYFDNVYRQLDHVRSAEIEQVLGMLSDPFGSVGATASMLTNADFVFKPATDSDGGEQQIVQGNITALMNESDRELRRSAWKNYTDQYLTFKNTLANNYATSVKQDIFWARVRGYENSLESALAPNNISTAVFDNLINTYQRHLPVWHRYWAIRRRALGVETLHPYDIWAPIAKEQPEVSYEQAVEWICDGLAPLGADYVATVQRGSLEDRWVDRYPNEGKRAGAFSSGWKGTHPFIMMSFTDDLQSMSTLAHELGHSMHSYLTWSTQPYIYSRYSMFVAEVASNFHQAMTRAYLFEQNDDPNFQIALIEEAMYNFHRYFFIMPTLARFEYEVHKRMEAGASLSADDMNELMADLFSEGYGDEMHVDRDRVGITWATFGHLYIAYYTFQYATGISGAHALANRILSGETGAVDDYLGFLKAGSSDYPVEVLRGAGVDLSTPDAVEQTFGVLNEYVDRLEKLVG